MTSAEKMQVFWEKLVAFLFGFQVLVYKEDGAQTFETQEEHPIHHSPYVTCLLLRHEAKLKNHD